MISTRSKIELFAAVLMVGLLVCAIRGWQLQREDAIATQANVEVQNKIIADHDAEIQNRDIADRNFSEQIQAQIDALKTQKQSIHVIEHYLPATPGQPAATVATVQRADLPPATQAELPEAPAYTILTPDQTSDIAKRDLQCDADRHSLTACQQDAVDLDAKFQDAEKQVADYRALAKGGTKLQRFGRILKYSACAAAGAYVGSKIPGQNNSGPAAIGAGAGVAACSMF